MNIRNMFVAIVLCGSLMLVGGCSSSSSDPTTPATFTIVGTWSYTMFRDASAKDAGTLAARADTWDVGTFTFTGSPESGTFTQVNIYNVMYTGTYTVTGVNVTLDGPENFSGAFTDAANLSGTWQSDSTSGDTGTWTAVKQ